MPGEVSLRFGNADHVLRSPTGSAYLLETKVLAGHITLEGESSPVGSLMTL
jgi:hypothetical protein